MPWSQNNNDFDGLFLCEFLTECHLPETAEIVEGYESNESIQRSWSQGEIVHLHAMKDLPQALARDQKGNFYKIPLNYPDKIFESIPNRCNHEYETVQDLIDDFPKYVRSLYNIPQSNINAGDILSLQEASLSSQGRTELKCKVVGTKRPIFLSCEQRGHFETLEEVHPSSLRDVTDRHILPTRVRVRAGSIGKFIGEKRIEKSLTIVIKEIVKEKVLIAYTLIGKHLRVLTIPISLEVLVRRIESNIDPKVLAEICQLIDNKINIESVITGRDEDASWLFEIGQCVETCSVSSDDETYDEIAPPVPSRTPTKTISGQKTTVDKSQFEDRYTAPPKPFVNKAAVGSAAPPVAKKPPKAKPSQGKSLILNNEEEEALYDDNYECLSFNKSKSTKAYPKDQKKSLNLVLPPVAIRPNVTQNKRPLSKEERPPTYLSPGQSASSSKPQLAEKPTVKPALKIGEVQPPSSHHPVSPTVASAGLNNEKSAPTTPTKSTSHKAESSVDFNPSRTVSSVRNPRDNGGARDTLSQELRNELTVNEVCEWLTKLGLGQYVETFEQESVDGKLLLDVDEEMMKDLGISNALHRRKLTKFIRDGWIPKTS